MVRIGRQTMVSTETGTISTIQLQHNRWEVRDDINHMQLYGYASATLPGTDLVCVNVAGDNSNGFIIASNHQTFRPKNLDPGEVQLYDNTGQLIYISQANDGTIFITANTAVRITAPTVIVQGDLHVTGSITAGFGGSDQVGLQTHKHGTGTAAAGTSAPSPNS
jgi:phage gp45-like